MKRNTPTFTGELRPGDKFYFQKNGDRAVFEVMNQWSTWTEINVRYPNGTVMYPQNLRKKKNVPVVFLRHTLPVPGEDINIEDLKEGDVIFLRDDVVTEYFIREHFNDQAGRETKVVNTSTKEISFVPHGTAVTFIRHENESIGI
jgi:hypothetical protein